MNKAYCPFVTSAHLGRQQTYSPILVTIITAVNSYLHKDGCFTSLCCAGHYYCSNGLYDSDLITTAFIIYMIHILCGIKIL